MSEKKGGNNIINNNYKSDDGIILINVDGYKRNHKITFYDLFKKMMILRKKHKILRNICMFYNIN